MKEMKYDWEAVRDNEIPSPEHEKELKRKDYLSVREILSLTMNSEDDAPKNYKEKNNPSGIELEPESVEENSGNTLADRVAGSNLERDIGSLYGVGIGEYSSGPLLNKKYKNDEALQKYIRETKETNRKLDEKNKQLFEALSKIQDSIK